MTDKRDKRACPSPEQVAAAGGYTRATLARWGVTWPPPKGWRRRLRRQWERAQRR